ncbi:gamma-secretase subunit APH-1B isoform X2 [Manis pentadactyla]|uniref:gamma-secretase subunit APH-1B isoform X2 n=1 Tax=Manis pentadactyla TaxID=143292 RepID=UPI00255CADFB|nr:gamma-secretase subunit APH-1B isoform X2 [Manis pentadactyla]
MTAAVFFGCAFIAFGPALALYIFTIATEPLRVIFLIVGAFFWLVSLLFSSFVWFMAGIITDNKNGPVQKYMLIFGVLVSVLIQEMFRFAYYKLLKKANEGLKSINPDETAPSMRLLAYVSGLGFGIMSGVFSFVNTLSDSLGPGTVGIHGDSPQFFLNSGHRTPVGAGWSQDVSPSLGPHLEDYESCFPSSAQVFHLRYSKEVTWGCLTPSPTEHLRTTHSPLYFTS